MDPEERALLERLLVMMAGDPTITDESHPDSRTRSVMGRFEAGNRRMDAIQQNIIENRKESERRHSEMDAKMDLIESNLTANIVAVKTQFGAELKVLRDQKFGWDKVTTWIRNNFDKVLKILGLAAIGLYVLWDRGLIGKW